MYEYLIYIFYCFFAIGLVYKTTKYYLIKHTTKVTNVAKKEISNIITDETINNKINSVLKSHLERISSDNEINKIISTMLKSHLIKLLDDDDIDLAFVQLLKNYLEKTSGNPEIIKAVNDAVGKQLDSMVEEDWFKNTLKEKFKIIITDACNDSEIKDQLAKLLEDVADELCKSSKTKTSIITALTDIANDKDVQYQIGIAMRKSAKSAIAGMFSSSKKQEKKDVPQENNS